MGIYNTIKTQNIITIQVGSTYQDTVTCTDQNGAALDLSDYTVVSQLRALDGTSHIDFTCTIPIPADGVVYRTLLPVITKLLVPAATIKYIWGLELTNTATDVVLPEIQGGALIAPEVVYD